MKPRWIIVTIILAAGGLLFVLANQRKAATPVREDAVAAGFPVNVVQAGRRRLDSSLMRSGTIQASNDVMVVSETVGRVLAVPADVGDSLRAGGILAKIDYELKLASFQAAEVALAKARSDQARFETLVEQKSATSAELEGVRLAFKAAEAQFMAARRQYQDCEIKSPIAGVVAARYVNVGATVGPGTPIANVVDLSKLKIILNVAERDAFALKTGDPVSVSVDVYPGKPFPGIIRTIGSKADDGHSFPVEVVLDNPADRPLRAGLFARVRMGSRSGRDILAIPREALAGSLRAPSVFLVENGIARLRAIVLGDESDGFLEVREGLAEGDKVVISGQGNLKDGTAVSVVD